jgi:hypothetical protein
MSSLPSNWSLRFPRTSREAFGHQIEFREDPDKLVGHVVAACVIFVLGLIVGGTL